MKKQILLSVLFLILQAVPLLWVACPAFGYRFIPYSEPLYLLLWAGLSIAVTAAAVHAPHPSLLALLALPAAALGGMAALRFTDTPAAALCAAACCICGGILFNRCAPGGICKTMAKVLSVLLVLLLAAASVLDFFSAVMSRSTVVNRIPSPDGRHTAIVTDHDHGATGGSVTVELYDVCRGRNLLLGCLTPTPQEVWRGPWGSSQDMEVLWKDDNTLHINGFDFELSRIGAYRIRVNLINETGENLSQFLLEYGVGETRCGGQSMCYADGSPIVPGDVFSTELLPPDFPSGADLRQFWLRLSTVDEAGREQPIQPPLFICADWGCTYEISLTADASGYSCRMQKIS